MVLAASFSHCGCRLPAHHDFDVLWGFLMLGVADFHVYMYWDHLNELGWGDSGARGVRPRRVRRREIEFRLYSRALATSEEV